MVLFRYIVSSSPENSAESVSPNGNCEGALN